MGETVNMALSVSVKSGPELRATWQTAPDAYEKTEFQLDSKQTQTVPLNEPDQIALLVISVGASDGEVTYTFGDSQSATKADQGQANGKVSSATSVDLKELPRILVYQQGMLPGGAKQLVFKKTAPAPAPADNQPAKTDDKEKPVTVDILIGRVFAAAQPAAAPANTNPTPPANTNPAPPASTNPPPASANAPAATS